MASTPNSAHPVYNPIKSSPDIPESRSAEEIKRLLGDRISVWMTSMGLGDTICATPTIRKIRELHKNHKIDVYTYYPEVFSYNKNVDSVYFFDEEKELNGHYRNLRINGYSKYFQTFSSNIVKPLVNHATTNIIDFCSIMALNGTLPDHEKWLEIPYSDLEKESLLEKTKDLAIDFSRAVIIHPSKTWPTRTWPQEKWNHLTDVLVENGYQVIAVGSSKPVIERRYKLEGNFGIYECPPKAINFIDKLSILETTALLNMAKFVVLTDSGLLHMAFATDIDIVGMFTIVHPKFRSAWRRTGFDYKFHPVKQKGACNYCTLNKDLNINSYTVCPLGEVPLCMPDVNDVYKTVEIINDANSKTLHQRRPMEKANTINPDVVCQQAIQAKLNVYQAKEQFETVLKTYNDNVDNLINLVNLMKSRILELESQKSAISKKDDKKQ